MTSLILLVAVLPLAVAAALVTIGNSISTTGPALARWRMGAADAIAYALPTPQLTIVEYRLHRGVVITRGHSKPSTVLDVLPSGARLARGPESMGQRKLTFRGRSVAAALSTADYASTLARGILPLSAGRLPEAPDEAVLSRAAAQRLADDTRSPSSLLGEAVESGSGPVTIVGIVETPECIGCVSVFGPVESRLAGSAEPSYPYLPGRSFLVSLPGHMVDAATVAHAARHGIALVPRQAFMGRGRYAISIPITQKLGVSATTVVLIGILGAFVLGGLCAAGFAVVQRKNLRWVGIMLINGATRGQAAKVLLTYAAMIWAGACALALLPQPLLLAAAQSHVEGAVGRRIVQWNFQYPSYLALVTITLVAMALASWAPARAAAGMSVATALSGEQPEGRRRARSRVGTPLVCVGLGLVLVALVRIPNASGVNRRFASLTRQGIDAGEPSSRVMLIGVAGFALLLIAVLATVPTRWMRTVSRLAGRGGPLTLRMAAQTLGRSATEYSVFFATVVVAVLLLLVPLGVTVGIANAKAARSLQLLPERSAQIALPRGMSAANVAQLRDHLSHSLPTRSVHVLSAVVSETGSSPIHVVVNPRQLRSACPDETCSATISSDLAAVDPGFLKFVLGPNELKGATVALLAGKVVTASKLAMFDGRVHLASARASSPRAAVVSAAAALAPEARIFSDLPQSYILPAATSSLHARAVPQSIYVALERALSSAEVGSLESFLESRGLKVEYADGGVGGSSRPGWATPLVGALVAGLFVAVALALVSLGQTRSLRLLELLGMRRWRVVTYGLAVSALVGFASACVGLALVGISVPIFQLSVGAPGIVISPLNYVVLAIAIPAVGMLGSLVVGIASHRSRPLTD